MSKRQGKAASAGPKSHIRLRLMPPKPRSRWQKVSGGAKTVGVFLKDAAPSITAAVAVGALILSFWSYQKTVENSDRQLQTAKDGQFADRFAKAVEQLASDKLDVRLGAIYALRSIALKSDDYKTTVAELMHAYAEEHSSHHPCSTDPGDVVAGDIAAAVQTFALLPPPDAGSYVLAPQIPGRSETNNDELAFSTAWRLPCWHGISLPGANMRGWYSPYLDLAQADLTDAHLEDSVFNAAVFNRAHLWRAHLHSARLWSARFLFAGLEGADFTEARLHGASFCGANLSFTVLRRADLSAASLARATLWKTDLTGAYLQGANLDGADLAGAYLDGADLSGVEYDKDTVWPVGFAPPLSTPHDPAQNNQELAPCSLS